eukprot:2601676-Rhodomonas_salina.1
MLRSTCNGILVRLPFAEHEGCTLTLTRGGRRLRVGGQESQGGELPSRTDAFVLTSCLPQLFCSDLAHNLHDLSSQTYQVFIDANELHKEQAFFPTVACLGTPGSCTRPGTRRRGKVPQARASPSPSDEHTNSIPMIQRFELPLARRILARSHRRGAGTPAQAADDPADSLSHAQSHKPEAGPLLLQLGKPVSPPESPLQHSDPSPPTLRPTVMTQPQTPTAEAIETVTGCQ